MKILVIGGTKFLGRHLVQEALRKNHTLTLFNRGETNPNLFPELEKIRGDRDGELAELARGEWDAVIDTCGYLPRIVEKSCKALANRVGCYVFISSVSVYADFSERLLDETAETSTLSDPDSEDVQTHYGPLKVRCEEVVTKGFPDRSLIIRPGIIVGPNDPTDRFTYWLRKIAESSQVLIPDCHGSAFQYIYIEDLAKWLIALIEKRCSGMFNTVTKAGALTWGDLFESCVKYLNPRCQLVRASDSFLEQNGVSDWSQFPLWIPQSRTELNGFYSIDSSRASEAGLVHSPLPEVLATTYDWVKSLGENYDRKLGLSESRERILIDSVLNNS